MAAITGFGAAQGAVVGDLTLSASTTVSTGLTLNYNIGDKWLIHYSLACNVTAGAAGLIFKLGTLPTSVTGRMTTRGETGAIGTYSDDTTTTLTTGSAAYVTAAYFGYIEIVLFVQNGTATGTIDLNVTTGASAAGTIFSPAIMASRYA